MQRIHQRREIVRLRECENSLSRHVPLEQGCEMQKRYVACVYHVLWWQGLERSRRGGVAVVEGVDPAGCGAGAEEDGAEDEIGVYYFFFFFEVSYGMDDGRGSLLNF